MQPNTSENAFALDELHAIKQRADQRAASHELLVAMCQLLTEELAVLQHINAKLDRIERSLDSGGSRL